jgi:hypothetical protein
MVKRNVSNYACHSGSFPAHLTSADARPQISGFECLRDWPETTNIFLSQQNVNLFSVYYDFKNIRLL